MKIVWDEIKRRANISKHGMDFADLEIDFFYAATILPAQGKRFMAIGGIEGISVTVVFSRLEARPFPSTPCGPPARRKGVSDDG